MTPPKTPQPDIGNRELSWLDFNSRVLEEAQAPGNPLLERLKFTAIVGSNLDEFFMVRVAGLRQQFESEMRTTDPAGLTPEQQLQRIRERVLDMLEAQYRCFRNQLLPALEKQRIRLARVDQLDRELREETTRYFEEQVLPQLTPSVVDPNHPFPLVPNAAIEIAVHLRNPHTGETRFALVETPKLCSRFVPVRDTRARSGGTTLFVLLEDLIIENLHSLFHEREILQVLPFRILRDMDFTVDEEDVADLLDHLEQELRRRKDRSVVRLDILEDAAPDLVVWLARQLKITKDMFYVVPGPLDLSGLWSLVNALHRPDLSESPWPPLPVPEIPPERPVVEAIRERGWIALFHPYQTFDPVVRFLEEAADDDAVLAIKQTLYRVSGDSPVIAALERAALRGKQVTAIIELKARFDEERNIQWARRLEKAGVHVTYGVAGKKVHCKAVLIVRREEGRLVRYVHLSTGNYNDKTAQLYTDIGIFTADAEICADVAALFNVMTGFSAPLPWSSIAAAPFGLRETFCELIDREARLSTPHRPGRIIAKMNSLVDPVIIRRLYAAAEAGVRIDLIVRGICCLRGDRFPERIRVVSIIDRFLEHSRIFYFANAGRPEYYLASADWMPRNLDRRIELLFPVRNAGIRRLLRRVLEFQLDDTWKGRILGPDNAYHRHPEPNPETRSQRRTYEFFLDRWNQQRTHRASLPSGRLRVRRRPSDS